MNHVKAEKRENKKRKKMNVHGRGIKSQPMRGIPKAAKKFFCLFVVLLSCFFVGVATLVQAQSNPPAQLFIISPSPGEVILSKKVHVILDFPQDSKGQPHARLWLDASADHDKSISIMPDGKEYTFDNISPGLHTLYVELFYTGDSTWSNDRPYDQPIFATVDFETIGEEIKPAPVVEEEAGATPGFLNGLFLPPGQGNTILTIVLIALAILILWYIFKHPRTKHD